MNNKSLSSKALFLISLLYQNKIISNSNNKISQNIISLFSPPLDQQKETCTEAICNEINAATSEIAIQAYSFTSDDIINALLNAAKRGVKINIIFDRSYADKKAAQMLNIPNVTIYVDTLQGPNRKTNQGIAHNKIMIIDNQKVITGSFNFTFAAESKNTENILILNDPQIAELYIENFNSRKKQSKSLIEYMTDKQNNTNINKKNKKWKRKRNKQLRNKRIQEKINDKSQSQQMHKITPSTKIQNKTNLQIEEKALG